jgi:hypothetical protein
MVKLKANSDVASPRNELTGITWLLTRVINITETPSTATQPQHCVSHPRRRLLSLQLCATTAPSTRVVDYSKCHNTRGDTGTGPPERADPAASRRGHPRDR